jgi:hypothetical protein
MEKGAPLALTTARLLQYLYDLLSQLHLENHDYDPSVSRYGFIAQVWMEHGSKFHYSINYHLALWIFCKRVLDVSYRQRGGRGLWMMSADVELT